MKSFINRTISLGRKLVNEYNEWLAAGLIALMGALSFGSMINNSAIMDEVAHIPAGYSYLHFGDYRLNPEHPPLLKDLAAIPLQFMHLQFPANQPAWTTQVNGQWDTGWSFLYYLGNNADAILFWSRLPILLLGLAFGFALFFIMRRYYGPGTALLVLLFYTLSPNILANSALVTTDLGASIFIFLALVAYARYIRRPDWTGFWLLVLALTAAQLSKFSALLLYPFLGLVSVGLIWLMDNSLTKLARLKTYVGGLIGAALVSLAGIWAYYATQMWNMPVAVQNKLIAGSLTDAKAHLLADWLIKINQWPIMHPIVQYFTGVAMVFGRVTGGNVTFFNGQVISGSFRGYFPELFFMKTQVGLLLLGAGLIAYVIWRSRNTAAAQWTHRLAENMRRHIFEWCLGLFSLFYFLVAVAGNLDLGIRHILPIYIPLFVLAAAGTSYVIRKLPHGAWQTGSKLAVAVLVVWYALSAVLAYPNYLSYFNETIGGGSNSSQYFSDSSVDWGQDLVRLQQYVLDHPEIHKIGIDYFGGGLPVYYFCYRKYDAHGALIQTADGFDCSRSVYQEWHAQYGTYTGQYIAVSETFLENDRFYAKLYHQPGYGYLRSRQPIAKIGNSIFVYKLY